MWRNELCIEKNEGGWGKTRGMIKAAISPLINFNRSAHGRPWWLIKFSGKTTFTSVPEPRYCAADSWKIYVANATEFVVVTYGIPGIFSALIARPPPQLPFQLFYRDSIQCQTETYMGKYIWGRVRNDAANENVENVFYRVWNDFGLCKFVISFSRILWQSLPIGDYLIPIPTPENMENKRAGNWDLWNNFSLYQKWFFLLKEF